MHLQFLDVTHLIVHLNLECIDLKELSPSLGLILAIHGSFGRGVQITDELAG